MFKLIHIDGTDLICYDDGNIWRFHLRWKKWVKFVSESKDYWRIRINKKDYGINRLMALAFKEGFTLDSELVVDHINGDIHNNSVDNLRVITQQQNTFNTNAKGYYKYSYIKTDGTEVEYWTIQLCINGKLIRKRVATEELARQGYLELKRIHHII